MKLSIVVGKERISRIGCKMGKNVVLIWVRDRFAANVASSPRRCSRFPFFQSPLRLGSKGMLREARCVESGISNLVEWIVLVRHDGRKGDDLLTFTEDPPADRAVCFSEPL